MSRVLLVGKGAPDRGGIPTYLESLRHGPLAIEHDFTLLNLAHSGMPQGGKVSLDNVRRTLADAIAVWQSARECELVHIHSALAPLVTVLRAGLLALAARLRGCGVIVHAHGGNIETWLTNRRRRQVMRLAMWPAHRVVAVWTAGERALADAIGDARVVLIDNGVDETRHPTPEPAHTPPRVLYVGLLTPRKGVLDLIEASQLLLANGTEHELLLLGGTPDEGPDAATPVLAAAVGHATLLGTRPPEEMPAAYATADVFCLPSWWEAMPLSVLEAMAGSVPVVATDVGDIGRAVRDGHNGYVVPVQSPQQLASALQRLLEAPALRQRMGDAGRARVTRKFSCKITARAVSELYAMVESER